MNEVQVPVLIAGGSLVGLSASVLLGAHGIDHLLVERHRGTAIHPRAASFHQRTMEIFRSAGLQREVEAAAAREFVQNGAIIAVDCLAGKELACFYRSFNDGVEGLSPTRRLFITQIGLEPVLRARAAELGAQHHYSTELVDFGQDEAGVTAVLRAREDGSERTIRARYLIAADGAHSAVRDRLGIGMTGRGAFADCVTIYFRADMRRLIGDRNLSVVYVNRPDMRAFFRFSITGDAGFLAIFSMFDADGNRTSIGSSPDPGYCARLVRIALGAGPDLAVEIDDVQPWSATAATAERFRDGSIFLAGDAAHLMPPTGGFGGNTGVADVHNLAWKLAMVLKGEAGPALLDSYEAERRPIAALTVEQAYARYVARVDPSLPAEGLAPLIDDAAIELGAIYRSAAVIADSPADDDKIVEDPRVASGRPGTRITHVDLGERVSTLDLAGADFVLVSGGDDGTWREAAARLGVEMRSTQGPAAARLGITDGGALLLRPDGVIAWRSRGIRADTLGELATALQRLTFGPPARHGPKTPRPTAPIEPQTSSNGRLLSAQPARSSTCRDDRPSVRASDIARGRHKGW